MRAHRLPALLVVAVCLVAAPPAAATGPLIAPPSACPDESSLAVAPARLEQAMACLSEFARRKAGLDGFDEVLALDRSAADKTRDILRCDSFSHFACGREFTYWMRQTGYISVPCWHVGENLAWGTGASGTPRSIFAAWMRSPAHRANILGDYDEFGVGIVVGSLADHPQARIWVEHFGAYCGRTP